MRNVQQNFKRWPVITGMMCVVALMLSSCVKSNNNNPNTNKPIAALSVIDASPDAPSLDLYLNGAQVNANAIVLGNYFNYFNAYAGKTTFTFDQAGTSTVSAQDTATLLANTYYTLFLTNKIATPDYILLKDNLVKPASGAFSIRLVNASPDAGTIDLRDKTTGTPLIIYEPYRAASNFTDVTINTTDTLQVVQSGTTTVLATVPVVKFVTSSVYTIWLYGLVNTTVTTQKLNAGIMQNAYYY